MKGLVSAIFLCMALALPPHTTHSFSPILPVLGIISLLSHKVDAEPNLLISAPALTALGLLGAALGSYKAQKIANKNTGQNEKEQISEQADTLSSDVRLHKKRKDASSKIKNETDATDPTPDTENTETHNAALSQLSDVNAEPNPFTDPTTEVADTPEIDSQHNLSEMDKPKEHSSRNLLNRAKNKLTQIKSSLKRLPKTKKESGDSYKHLDTRMDYRKANAAQIREPIYEEISKFNNHKRMPPSAPPSAPPIASTPRPKRINNTTREGQVTEPAYQEISKFDNHIYQAIPEPDYEVIPPPAPTTPRPKRINKTTDITNPANSKIHYDRLNRQEPKHSNNDYDHLDTGTYNHLDRQKSATKNNHYDHLETNTYDRLNRQKPTASNNNYDHLNRQQSANKNNHYDRLEINTDDHLNRQDPKASNNNYDHLNNSNDRRAVNTLQVKDSGNQTVSDTKGYETMHPPKINPTNSDYEIMHPPGTFQPSREEIQYENVKPKESINNVPVSYDQFEPSNHKNLKTHRETIKVRQ